MVRTTRGRTRTVGGCRRNTAHNSPSCYSGGIIASSLGGDGCGSLDGECLEEILLEIQDRPGVSQGCARDEEHVFHAIAERVDARGLEVDAVARERARRVVEQ